MFMKTESRMTLSPNSSCTSARRSRIATFESQNSIPAPDGTSPTTSSIHKRGMCNSRANRLANVDFPVPGRPEKSMSFVCILYIKYRSALHYQPKARQVMQAPATTMPRVCSFYAQPRLNRSESPAAEWGDLPNLVNHSDNTKKE